MDEFDPTTPYHLSSRCINREWFGLEMPRVWDLFCDELFFIKHAYDLKIFSFVLMNNHFHLIAQAPESNMSQAMAYFLRETSRELTKTSGRINQTWGGRFFRSRLGSDQHYLNSYKYIYQNPLYIKDGTRAESYPYSTLSGLLGLQKLLIPLEYDTLLFEGCLEENLKWLNQLPSEENRLAMQKALRRRNFTLPKVGPSREPHPLETLRL